MNLNRQQLEEIDNIFTAADSFLDEPSIEDDDFINNQDEEIAFRREMLERALSRIQAAKITKFTPSNKYTINDIVFDPFRKKFARVKSVTKSSIVLRFISSGEEISFKISNS